MRRVLPLPLAAALCLIALPAAAIPIQQVIALSPDLEVMPSIPPGTTPAFGTALITFDPDMPDNGIQFEFDLYNIGSPLLQAHIHIGAPGQNGPVLVFLFNFCDIPTGCGPDDEQISGDAVEIDGNAGPLAGTNTYADVIEQIVAGNAYINIHTTDFRPGELRGNFPGVPEPSAALLVALGLGAALRRR